MPYATYDRPCRVADCEGRATGGRAECWPCFLSRRGGGEIVAATEGWEPAGASARYGADGEFKGSSVRFAPPKAKLELAPATPVEVRVSVGPPEHRPYVEKVAVFLPDPQIGYRFTDDGELEAFHDEDAMQIAVQHVARLDPDFVVHLGDLLDLAPFSRFAREPGFRGTTQPTLDRAHQYLAEVKAVAEGAEHVLIAGNHDVRIEREVAKLLPEVAGLRQPGSKHAALSIPALLGLDALEIQYVGGYPAGEFWLSDQLRAIHGNTVASGGSTAAKIAGSTVGPFSTVFGHVHRSEFHTQRVRTGRDSSALIWAASPGTLARIDGAVPSFHSGVEQGASVYEVEDWAQGIGVARWVGDDMPQWQWIGF